MSKAFSAPGKALLAGGYLVLDPNYGAYVTALSSRMHAVIESSENVTEDYSMCYHPNSKKETGSIE